MGLVLQWNSGLIIWDRDARRLTDYSLEQAFLGAGSVWLVGSKQELWVRL